MLLGSWCQCGQQSSSNCRASTTAVPSPVTMTSFKASSFLVLLACSVVIAAAERPWFCHELDCPKFTVTRKNDFYETRIYTKGKWASTQVQGYVYAASLTQGFYRLFDYIGGKNEPNVKINMTAPVVTKVEHGDGPFCKSNFTVSFFVPFADQDDTPQPSSKDVYIHDTPSATFYVSQYSGFSMDDITVTKHANELIKKLDEDGEKYEEGFYFTAGYDAPFKLTGRHNEIWLLKKAPLHSEELAAGEALLTKELSA